MGGTYSTETLFSIDQDKNRYRYAAKFDDELLGQGAFRYAYRGEITSSQPAKGPRVGDKCVVKAFKAEYARNYDQWVPDLVAHERAAKMADSFNSVPIYSAKNRATITMMTPLVARIESLAGFYFMWTWNMSEPPKNIQQGEYVSIEPYMTGNWRKFNSNGGWCDDNYPLLQTFSHWSACKSGFRYLLCDLQGVERGNQFLITDPAIHSLDQIHGPSDLGIVGMERFMARHRCNDFCTKLNLSRNPVPSTTCKDKIGTTYSFQLTREEQDRNRKKMGAYINPMSCIPELAF